MSARCLLACITLVAPVVRAQGGTREATEVREQVEFLRGLQLADPPEVELPDEPGLRAALERRAVPETGAARRTLGYMVGAMGFVRRGLDVARWTARVLEKQVFGGYDPGTHKIWIHPRAKDYGAFVRRLLMVRPWAQALDEQHFHVSRLAARLRGNHDRSFALRAVYEGSASGRMQQWAVAHRKGRSMSELLRVKTVEDRRNRVAFESPRYFSAQMAAGLLGLRFLTEGKGSASLLPDIPIGIERHVEKAYRDLPRSSEQILHPEKYWDETRVDEPVSLADEADFAARLARLTGARIVRRDTVGEFYCGILVSPPISRIRPERMRRAVGRPGYWSTRASQGWGGDRLFVVEKDGEMAIAWFTFWDTEPDAAEFRAQFTKLRAARLGFGGARSGRVAVFANGFCKPYLDRLLGLGLGHGRPKKGKAPFRLRDRVLGRPR